jgi:hypothetical protein
VERKTERRNDINHNKCDRNRSTYEIIWVSLQLS